MLIRLPAYLKVTLILLGLILLLHFLTLFKALFVPLIFAALFSFLMHPTCRALENARIPRPFAIVICLLIIMIVIAAVIWFLSSQMLNFREEMSGIGTKVDELLIKVQLFLKDKFGKEIVSRTDLVRESLSNLGTSGGSVVSTTISFTTDMLTFVTLVPIYFFCMLYYRTHMRMFMFQFVKAENRTNAMNLVDEVRKVVQGYLTGLSIVILIVALLNSAGLLILGVKYAVFFGVAASILMIIPYIGILIGSIIPALYVLVTTGQLSTALGVIGLMAFVQFLEGNFITPNVVGSKVRLNAFAAILGLVVGGHIWGAAGMILAIPVIAILKVIFDHNKKLKPFGFLLADISESEEEGMFSGLFRKIRNVFTKQDEITENPKKKPPL